MTTNEKIIAMLESLRADGVVLPERGTLAYSVLVARIDGLLLENRIEQYERRYRLEIERCARGEQ